MLPAPPRPATPITLAGPRSAPTPGSPHPARHPLIQREIMRTPTYAGTALLLLGATTLLGCPSPEPVPATPGWSIVLDESALPGAVLSVWGPSPDEVFIAGGPLGNSGSSAL